MAQFTRRSFFGTAAKATVGLLGFLPAAKYLAHVPTAHASQTHPNYVGCGCVNTYYDHCTCQNNSMLCAWGMGGTTRTDYYATYDCRNHSFCGYTNHAYCFDGSCNNAGCSYT